MLLAGDVRIGAETSLSVCVCRRVDGAHADDVQADILLHMVGTQENPEG